MSNLQRSVFHILKNSLPFQWKQITDWVIFSVYPKASGLIEGNDRVKVFAIDTGLNPDHPFYKSLTAKGIEPEWLWGVDEEDPNYNQKVDLTGHGTCMASLIVSEEYGAAKDAQRTYGLKLNGHEVQ